MHIKKYYGIVEGFFSDPLPLWTHQERLKTLHFIIENCPHINTYFYTPKNDRWVEQQPFALYPAKKLNELREIVALCKRQKLTFVYGFNPVFTPEQVEHDFEAYITSIMKKISQLFSIGVRNFCILYDEISFALNFDEAKIHSKNDAYIGQTHARILNTLLQHIRTDIDTLWFCPPDYSFSRTTPYLSALLKDLDTSIPIIWTGDAIFTKTISPELLRKGKSVVGKKRDIIYWDNYPVNDCPHPIGTFHIGAFNAPSYRAHSELKGILMNPMRECFANFIAYLTLEAYLRSPCAFDRKKAFYNAFRILFGTNWKQYASLYETFADKNVADDSPRGYYEQLLRTDSAGVVNITTAIRHDLEALVPPNTLAGRSFVQTTGSILKRAKNIQEVFSRMISNKGWGELFLTYDTFPVTLNKKYLTRQFVILVKRLTLADMFNDEKSAFITAVAKMLIRDRFSIPREKPRTALEHQLVALLHIFIKYKDKNRLSITDRDAKRLSDTLHVLVPLERHFFLQKIRHLPAEQKIRAFIFRSQINFY